MQETGETAAYLIEEHREKKRVGIAGEITMAAHYYNISRAKTIFELIGKHFK